MQLLCSTELKNVEVFSNMTQNYFHESRLRFAKQVD